MAKKKKAPAESEAGATEEVETSSANVEETPVDTEVPADEDSLHKEGVEIDESADADEEEDHESAVAEANDISDAAENDDDADDPAVADHVEDDGDSETPVKDNDDAGSDEEDPVELSDGDEAAEEAGESPLALAAVVEAILFAAREPLKPAQIARAVGRRTRQDAVKDAMGELNVHYLETGRAFEIAEISGRYQLMSRPEFAPHIMKIYPKREVTGEKEKSARLTPAALDTLAIIAYKQPVTRAEIEHVRGVGCGPVLKALMERDSIRIAGKRLDMLGQPLVYGTTENFLAEFGLGSLDELPMRNDFLAILGEEIPPMEVVQPPESEGESAVEVEELVEDGVEPSGTDETDKDTVAVDSGDAAEDSAGDLSEEEETEVEPDADDSETGDEDVSAVDTESNAAAFDDGADAVGDGGHEEPE